MSLLLGYYADMLFLKYEDAFVKTFDFLLGSVAQAGDLKALAIQSADTLSTIISDRDLVPRLEPHVPRLISTLINESNLKVHNNPAYFSFLLDFVKYYHHTIGESILGLVSSLVQRVLLELKSCHEKGEKNNLVINKCWNVIRLVTELDSFMKPYASNLEEALKPLFEFMTDPR